MQKVSNDTPWIHLSNKQGKLSSYGTAFLYPFESFKRVLRHVLNLDTVTAIYDIHNVNFPSNMTLGNRISLI